jgi:hypothetical protein
MADGESVCNDQMIYNLLGKSFNMGLFRFHSVSSNIKLFIFFSIIGLYTIYNLTYLFVLQLIRKLMNTI